MAEPVHRVDCASTSELAALLCVTHEYARRLIVKSGVGKKNKSGFWSISRAWCEKFARLRENYRVNEKVDFNAILDAPITNYQVVNIIYSNGKTETLSVAEHELQKLRKIFGSFPLILSPEDESVLRVIEAFNTKRSGHSILRRSWPADWAARLKQEGTFTILLPRKLPEN